MPTPVGQVEKKTQERLQAGYGSIPAWQVNNRQIYPAMSFAAQVLSRAQVSPRPLAEQLRRRVPVAPYDADAPLAQLEFP